MNIVFYILATLIFFLTWILLSPIFNKIGEIVINIYNKINNTIKGDNKNE